MVVRAVHPPSGTDLVDWFADDPRGHQRVKAANPFFDPEFEFFAGETEGALGRPQSGRGLDELADVWREWLKPWRGSDSDVEQVGASLWTLRDGKVSRIEFYARRAEAPEAAGLRE